MTVLITLTTAGASTGPFNLYSNVDGYAVPFETNVNKGNLVAGYTSTLVPAGATTIQVRSLGVCTNGINLTITGGTTTSTTSTTTTSTTTTTVAPTTSTSTTSTTTTTTEAPVNSVEFFGDELPAYGGIPNGFTILTGTVEIIGSPVTFRGYVYIPDEEGSGATSFNIGGNGGQSVYIELQSPNFGNAYSPSMVFTAGVYTWEVIYTYSGVAGSMGEGGIDWVQ
jgi:hypothetical protein